MKNMTLQNITSAVQGVYHGVDSLLAQEVSGITIDSRNIETDFLFIPIKGVRVDGHDYIPQVMEKGALCTLSEHVLVDATFPYIQVESCEQALKDLAEFYRQQLDITVIGITGSVGKTSTKEMVSSVVEQQFKVLKTAGNYNNEIGVPLTIFRLTEEHQVAVIEMGINHFGEMTRLSKIARPDIVIITNIGQCHLEFLIDRAGVLKAKTEIFEYMNPQGMVVLNGEDDMLRTVTSVHGNSPCFFGLDDTRDIYTSTVENLGLTGTACTIHLQNGATITPTISIPGHHMVLNALAGAAVGEYLGMSGESIAAGIHALTPVSGRNNIIQTDCLTIIDDCYNANPTSMKASLDVLTTAITRQVAILGDMGELGSDEAMLHQEVGTYAASCNLDVICCIGALSKHMLEGATQYCKSHGATMTQQPTILHFDDKEQFLANCSTILEKNDAILVKASHFMGFESLVSSLETMTI